MRALVVAVLVVAGCEQHTPPPVRHVEPPPPPGDGGVAVVDDARFVRGATYCPGTTAWPAGSKTCTTDGDCPHGRCYPDGVPDYSGMCGVAPREIEKCATDRDCGAHAFCDHTYEHHGCDEVIVAQCVPACTATSCKPGEVCGKHRRCGPAQCADGFACQAGWTCDKAGYIHDEHGCRQPPCTATSCAPNMRCTGEVCDTKPCSSSADCDCGACFNGRCASRPGMCGPLEEPSPPP